MKTFNLLAAVLLSALCASASAATDRSYYVTEVTAQQKFDVYNDGRNTYIQSVPGLVVNGATADGEFFIVRGVPNTIRGHMNGKSITVVRGTPPAPKPVTPDPAVVNAQIKKLSDQLASLDARTQYPGGPAAGAAAPTTSAQAAAMNGRPPLSDGAARSLAELQAKNGNMLHAAASAAPSINDRIMWRVAPTDQNLRLLMERYTKTVGWSAVWDVDKDINIGSADEKQTDFKSAVRRALASTEFGDIQVKPCFYSNNVLRVVRKTTKCNPNE